MPRTGCTLLMEITYLVMPTRGSTEPISSSSARVTPLHVPSKRNVTVEAIMAACSLSDIRMAF